MAREEEEEEGGQRPCLLALEGDNVGVDGGALGEDLLRERVHIHG